MSVADFTTFISLLFCDDDAYPEYQNRTNDYIFVGYTFMSDFVRLRGQIEVCFSKDPSTPCIYLCMHISMSEQQKFLFYERSS